MPRRGRRRSRRGRGHRASPAVRGERAGCEFGLERGALLEQGGARARVDVVEEFERVELGLDRHDLAGRRRERFSGIRDLGTHRLAERALGDEVLLEPLDGVAALPVLHLARLAVSRRVVGVRVRLDAVGDALDEGRAAARARALDRQRGSPRTSRRRRCRRRGIPACRSRRPCRRASRRASGGRAAH